jgi:hypothetical protein
MLTSNTNWTVHPHGPIEKLAQNLWRVEGTLPKMALKRVMTLARLADGGLVIHNGVAMDEVSMEAMEDWGEPRYLIVPNGWHRADAPAFVARYPKLQVFCPRGATKRVAKVVKVDGSYTTFPSHDAVSLEPLEGLGGREGVMSVQSEDGTTLIFNDAIFNQPHLPGAEGFVMRLMGSTGGPKVTRLGRLVLMKGRVAFQAHLRRLADMEALRRVIVSHGEMVEDDPRAMLHMVADAF